MTLIARLVFHLGLRLITFSSFITSTQFLSYILTIWHLISWPLQHCNVT